jgi:hypothetical protein
VIVALLAAGWLAAFAGDGACAGLAPVDEGVSVSWVMPAGNKVGLGGWVDAVRTSDLRDWAASESSATVGGLLRHLGYRKRKSEPHRRWVVVVFGGGASAPCRPVADDHLAEVAALGGLPACSKPGPVAKQGDGCGRVLSSDGSPGPEVLRLKWKDAAAAGFCVVPVERFLTGP